MCVLPLYSPTSERRCLDDDVLGDDHTVIELQNRLAAMFGKEAGSKFEVGITDEEAELGFVPRCAHHLMEVILQSSLFDYYK